MTKLCEVWAVPGIEVGEVQCLSNPSPLSVGLEGCPEAFIQQCSPCSVLLSSLCSSHVGNQVSRRKLRLGSCRRGSSVALNLVGPSAVLAFAACLMLIVSDRKCKGV